MLAMARRRQGIGRIHSTQIGSAAYSARSSVAPFGMTEKRREGPLKMLRATGWQSLKAFVRDITIGVNAALALAGNAVAPTGWAPAREEAVDHFQTALTTSSVN